MIKDGDVTNEDEYTYHADNFTYNAFAYEDNKVKQVPAVLCLITISGNLIKSGVSVL